MSKHAFGNLKGLAPSERRQVDKLFERKLDSDELVGFDFAKNLLSLANQLRRRIGVLVNREGGVEEVCVGSKDLLYLPDLGRYRLGQSRLRRLRLIFSDLSVRHQEAEIPSDIYTDLSLLRLDAVVSLKQLPGRISTLVAYLGVGQNQELLNHAVPGKDLSKLALNFNQLMREVEDDLSRLPSTVKSANRAILVGVYPKNAPGTDASIAELSELARTAGLDIAKIIVQKRDADPRTLLGKGKLEEVVLECLKSDAEILVFDGELKPGQWRAITNSTELKILDRSMLILDIFASRAKSSDGRLQVELAQLKYNLPRLVETDTGLSRLTGGIGGRGPGETKLEIGRRRIRERISELEKRIEKLRHERELRRQKRKERELPLVSIVGYTNVGKSTLFNALTKSGVFVENKLFATLDTTQRKLYLPKPFGKGLEVVISDTVGFIRDLPIELKNAFKATLEELEGAALILHVIDASDELVLERKRAVDLILSEMNLASFPQLVVLNKIDKVAKQAIDGLKGQFDAVAVSASNNLNLAELLQAVEKKLSLTAQADIEPAYPA